MTNKYEELICIIEDKFQKLSSEYKSLKLRNETLASELERKQKELEQAYKSKLEIQENYDHLRMARYLNVSPKERKISKRYMDKLVREIDKCLALLNE